VGSTARHFRDARENRQAMAELELLLAADARVDELECDRQTAGEQERCDQRDDHAQHRLRPYGRRRGGRLIEDPQGRVR
jgi:hypothetical protein